MCGTVSDTQPGSHQSDSRGSRSWFTAVSSVKRKPGLSSRVRSQRCLWRGLLFNIGTSHQGRADSADRSRKATHCKPAGRAVSAGEGVSHATLTSARLFS